jgi:Na+-transporting methylmalonyl-CoA/oxaloacetate decarboxylase gamma subunit
MTKVSDSKKKLIIIGLAFLFIILIILFIVMIAKRDNSKQDE